MKTRRSALPDWAIPLCYAVVAVLMGLLLPRIERKYFATLTAPVSAPVALTLVSSITSGMIALTGIVFSLAFVMVQFSAVAYSPRLVMWVSRDPVIWHSIGMFTATFLYGIGEMAWIDRGASGTVPLLTSWLVIFLTLGSVGMFVALIQRLALLQITQMLVFTGSLGRRTIEDTYPEIDTPPSVARREEFQESAVTQIVVHSGGPQALQAIDKRDLLMLSTQTGGCVEVMAAVGDTLISGMPILRVFGGNNSVDDDRWRRAFARGSERTFEQDPKYAIRLLVDIAIKALSPAINDPTTAVQALDHIQDQLLRLGRRRLEIGAEHDARGILKLVIPHPTWEDFLTLAFDEIRFYGATSVQVMRRMHALVGDLIALLPPERHSALEAERERLNSSIARSFSDEYERRKALVEDRQGLGMTRAH